MHYMAVLASWLAVIVPGPAIQNVSADPSLNPLFSCAQLWYEDRGYVEEDGSKLTADGWALDVQFCV